MEVVIEERAFTHDRRKKYYQVVHPFGSEKEAFSGWLKKEEVQNYCDKYGYTIVRWDERN